MAVAKKKTKCLNTTCDTTMNDEQITEYKALLDRQTEQFSEEEKDSTDFNRGESISEDEENSFRFNLGTHYDSKDELEKIPEIKIDSESPGKRNKKYV